MKRTYQLEKTDTHKIDKRGEMTKHSACIYINDDSG